MNIYNFQRTLGRTLGDRIRSGSGSDLHDGGIVEGTLVWFCDTGFPKKLKGLGHEISIRFKFDRPWLGKVQLIFIFF
jgi:hypothetical protein